MSAAGNSYTLGDNISATGHPVAIVNGDYAIFVEGTLGGAQIDLQVEGRPGSWYVVRVADTGSTITPATLPYMNTPLRLPAGQYRLAVTGGTPSGIYAKLVCIG